MNPIERDEEREERIENEAIVDAYGPEEQAMGWFYYLDEKIGFPFRARCSEERRISPLKLHEEVVVLGMADEDDCMHEMYVEVEWQDRRLGVPLVQIEALDADDNSVEAIDDWKYWFKRGYQLV
jgi:hypothetical protein